MHKLEIDDAVPQASTVASLRVDNCLNDWRALNTTREIPSCLPALEITPTTGSGEKNWQVRPAPFVGEVSKDASRQLQRMGLTERTGAVLEAINEHGTDISRGLVSALRENRVLAIAARGDENFIHGLRVSESIRSLAEAGATDLIVLAPGETQYAIDKFMHTGQLSYEQLPSNLRNEATFQILGAARHNGLQIKVVDPEAPGQTGDTAGDQANSSIASQIVRVMEHENRRAILWIDEHYLQAGTPSVPERLRQTISTAQVGVIDHTNRSHERSRPLLNLTEEANRPVLIDTSRAQAVGSLPLSSRYPGRTESVNSHIIAYPGRR